MILSLGIAFKFYKSCKKNVLISLVSLISIIGIAIGIIIAILALSIINGFENELDNRILSVIPHVEIIPINLPFNDWQKILDKIKTIPNIISTNPYISFPGIIELNHKWHLIHIKSINLINDNIVRNNNYKLINFIEKQSWEYFCKNKNQIILGKGASNALNIKTGDWITIMFVYDVNSKNKFASPNKIRLQVSGILNLNSQLDENLAIISLSDARNYCNHRLDIDGIDITIKNVFDIDQIIQKIKKAILHTNIVTRNWMDTYGYIYKDIQIVRFIIYLSVVLIIGMSYFNVVTALILCIKNKYYDIAILRALGASNILIQRIFLWYGFIMYCISSVIGSSLGVLITLNLKNVDINSVKFFGKKIFMDNIYFIDFIPIYFNICNLFYILGIVLLLGLLVSWYVSFNTKKINLAQMLK